MPVCSVCGQAEHQPYDGVLDHCHNCQTPVYAGTSYWLHRRARLLVDHYFCLECVTWGLTMAEKVTRAARLMARRRGR